MQPLSWLKAPKKLWKIRTHDIASMRKITTKSIQLQLFYTAVKAWVILFSGYTKTKGWSVIQLRPFDTCEQTAIQSGSKRYSFFETDSVWLDHVATFLIQVLLLWFLLALACELTFTLAILLRWMRGCYVPAGRPKVQLLRDLGRMRRLRQKSQLKLPVAVREQ